MPEEVAIIIVFGMVLTLAWGVLGTIKTIVIKKYEARSGPDTDGLRRDVAALGRRMEALENGMLRVQELEERVDFAERLLAQQRHGDAGRLAQGRE